ncbi:MAG: Aminomethyltransferase [Phycisphaerae bacterium]|nr:Aminomethyltransferase [Phycisphaerae bacterium]
MYPPDTPLARRLAQAGAVWPESPVGPVPLPLHLGDPAAELRAARTGVGLLDWSARGRLLLRGRDAFKWLGGLVTQAVADLADGAARYAFALNRQGRILSDLHCVRLGDAMLIDLPSDRLAEAKAHFDKYLIAEDVTISPADGTARLCLVGPGAEELAAQVGGASVRSIVESAGGLPGACDLLADADAIAAAWDALLSRGARPIGSQAVDALRVRAGVAWFGVDFDSTNLPAETGQLGRAVSFTKGCYIGQEVVARMKALGAPARVIAGVTVAAQAVPPRGAAVSAGGQPAGCLTTVAADDGGLAGLAMLNRRQASPGTAVEVTWPGGCATGCVVALPTAAS